MDTKRVGSTNAANVEGLTSKSRNEKIQQNGLAGLAQPKTGSSLGTDAAGNFGVSLSPKSRELAEARAKALNIARNTPDIREDKVAAMKAKIASGEFNPSSEQIADGMAREAIMDELSLRSHEEARQR